MSQRSPVGAPRRKEQNLTSIRHYTKLWASLTAITTLLIAATAVLLADFGVAGWIFFPLLLWLATIGLPTTTAVLLTASVWGTTPLLSGGWLFSICSLLLCLLFQSLAFCFLAKWRRTRGKV